MVKMLTNNRPNLLISAIALLALGACTQGSGLVPSSRATDSPVQTQGGGTNAPAAPEKAFYRFPDIPVPTKAIMDTDRTLVFGGGESWYGQLSLDASHSADALFDFYKQELPAFAWQEVTSVRAPVSVLTYERQGRVLSIQIESARLGGAKITLTVSPRGGTAPVMN